MKGTMNMAINTFKRYENKYVLTREQYDIIMRRIHEQMRPDDFCRGGAMYQVNTIYYDTPGFDVIRRCMSFPGYKEKLRMRSYGTPKSDEDKVFVCIKKKLINEGNKRRAVMKLREAKEFLATGNRPKCTDYINEQVMNEIEYFNRNLELRPAVFISYDREAFFGKEDDSFRVTVDSNLLYRTTDLDLKKGAYGARLLDANKYLMEIKIPGAMPLWISHALSYAEAFPVGFSKYRRAFEAEQHRPEIKMAI